LSNRIDTLGNWNWPVVPVYHVGGQYAWGVLREGTSLPRLNRGLKTHTITST